MVGSMSRVFLEDLCCSDCHRVERTASRRGLTPGVDHHVFTAHPIILITSYGGCPPFRTVLRSLCRPVFLIRRFRLGQLETMRSGYILNGRAYDRHVLGRAKKIQQQLRPVRILRKFGFQRCKVGRGVLVHARGNSDRRRGHGFGKR